MSFEHACYVLGILLGNNSKVWKVLLKGRQRAKQDTLIES